MAAGTLYTYPDSFRAQKILIAAEYSGTKINVPPFTVGKDNKTAEFLKKFPLGKVPAFETSDGKYLYESNAIAYFVSNDQLHGSGYDAALIQQYVNFADQEILPAAATWVFPTLGLMQYQKQATDKAMEDIKKCMTVLNNTLLTKTFLVGERVTLADIAVCCNLLLLYKQVMDPSFCAPYGNVNRWFATLINQPQFKKVLGEVKLCVQMAKFDGKTYAALHGKKDDKKKDKAKEQKPKQEKKPAEKPQEEKPKPEKKSTDPFADLPPSSMSLDAWKKVYMNEDTETVAIPYFWENLDKVGFSLWLGVYKPEYAKELNMTFMTRNLVNGMVQRIEKLSKNAFGITYIFGVNNNNTIAGLWLMRGQELAFNLSENWSIDSPSYDWTKLDPDNEQDKQKISDFLLWKKDLTFDGKMLMDPYENAGVMFL